MADTFLNTGMATNNVQNNLSQTNNTQAMQTPTVPNQQQNSAQQSQINPITIPIQIQPQIAQVKPGYPASNVQQNQKLQVQNESTQGYNAPTPQPYNNANTNSTAIDFNQIYNSYNNALGRNQTNTNNGTAKKTSYNTTIVTPTVSNLNSVEGQYQSAYSDTINGVIGSLLSQIEQLRTGDFGYDPTQDSALRLASEYAANSTLQSLAGSGVLNSTATAERVARIVSELIPQYEEKAYNRQLQYLNQLADTAQLVMNFDSQQFDYWKDAKDREFKEKEFEFEKQQKDLENAWKRVDELGYVDNEASTILGVKVGTLSAQAREAKEQREFELQKMREQLETEHANNIALAQLRSDLDLRNSKEMASLNNSLERENMILQNQLDTNKSKELASYNNSLERSNMEYQNKLDIQKSKEIAAYENDLKQGNMEYEYKLANKYGSNSSNSTKNSNLSTYDDIIKNRFAEYDDFTKQYVVPDQATYNQLVNYLDNLYASGQITESEFLQLSAKYSKYNGQNSGTNNNTNSSSNNNQPTLDDVVGQLRNAISIFK